MPLMPRLTITLTDERHRALKETAYRTRKSIRSLIEESLDAYGLKTLSRAAEIVAKARKQAALSEKDAMRIAVAETRVERKRKR
jgi:hypothetical protein